MPDSGSDPPEEPCGILRNGGLWKALRQAGRGNIDRGERQTRDRGEHFEGDARGPRLDRREPVVRYDLGRPEGVMDFLKTHGRDMNPGPDRGNRSSSPLRRGRIIARRDRARQAVGRSFSGSHATRLGSVPVSAARARFGDPLAGVDGLGAVRIEEADRRDRIRFVAYQNPALAPVPEIAVAESRFRTGRGSNRVRLRIGLLVSHAASPLPGRRFGVPSSSVGRYDGARPDHDGEFGQRRDLRRKCPDRLLLIHTMDLRRGGRACPIRLRLAKSAGPGAASLT